MQSKPFEDDFIILIVRNSLATSHRVLGAGREVVSRVMTKISGWSLQLD